MPNEAYYVYAFTWADCPPETLGPAIDPRFPIELVASGRVAALAGRVGLDQFDLAKLQPPRADVDWISRVAVCHHQIVAAAARCRTVLPLRMGTLFQSRESLVARLVQWQATILESLQRLDDRDEWATKIYLQASAVEPVLGEESPQPAAVGSSRAGTQYLVGKRQQAQVRRTIREDRRQQIAALEAALVGRADSHCCLRVLPEALTGRRDKMLWNAAFLVPRSARQAWLLSVEHQRDELASQSLLLEASGPWPPYHFCPQFAS